MAMIAMTSLRSRTAWLRRNTACLVAAWLTASALGAVVLPAVAGAAEVTSDQIMRALAPKQPLTRGLSMAPPQESADSAAQASFVNTLRNRPTRSLSLGEREQIASVAGTRPTIDLEINFDYDSANISSSAMPTVRALGEALTSGELKGSTFLLAGHTDAAGSDAYNQGLSERRADAIKAVLMSTFGVPGAELLTVGYGESKLKKPAAPMDASNRRVQIVNMANKSTASR